MGKSIYDENLYLARDPEVMLALEKKRVHFLYTKEDQRLKYKEIIEKYNRFLLVLRDFFQTLDLDIEMKNMIALAWMIKNGYLSVEKEYKNEELTEEIAGRYGITILEGLGVCRNFTEMGHDLMRLLDYYSKQLYVYSPNMSLPSSARTKKANHVINLIDHEGVKYGMDIYNGCALFHFIDRFTLKRITQKTPKKYRYKPYYEYTTGEKTIDEIKLELEQMEMESKKPTISAIEYEEGIYPDTIAFMSSHRDLCEDFHRETAGMKRELVNSLYK